jgi:hypothetical protein
MEMSTHYDESARHIVVVARLPDVSDRSTDQALIQRGKCRCTVTEYDRVKPRQIEAVAQG